MDLPGGSILRNSPGDSKPYSALQFKLRSLGRLKNSDDVKGMTNFENLENGAKDVDTPGNEMLEEGFSFRVPGKRSNKTKNKDLDKLGTFSFGIPGKRSTGTDQEQLDQLGRFSFGIPGKRSTGTDQQELDQFGRFSFGISGKRSTRIDKEQLDQLGRFSFRIPGKKSTGSDQQELDQLERFSFRISGKRSTGSDQQELDQLGRFSFGIPGKRSTGSDQQELDQPGRISFVIPGKRVAISETEQQDQPRRLRLPMHVKTTKSDRDKLEQFMGKLGKSSRVSKEEKFDHFGGKTLKTIDGQFINTGLEVAEKRTSSSAPENNNKNLIGSKFGLSHNKSKPCEDLMKDIVYLIMKAKYMKNTPSMRIAGFGRIGKRNYNLVTKEEQDADRRSAINSLQPQSESRPKKLKTLARAHPFFR